MNSAPRLLFPTIALALLWGAAGAQSLADAPPAHPPFSDFRTQAPGRVHHITVDDLPAPYASPAAGNPPKIVARPPDVLPVAPPGFRVNPYASGLSQPRVIRVAPGGDVFVAESAGGRVRVYRGLDASGKPESTSVFARGLDQPYGIAFYPPGPKPQWVYVGTRTEVLRFPYQAGALQALGEPEHIADLPHGGGHSTRDLAFSLDGSTLFVAVGSASNVDDPDTTSAEKDRADILAFDPQGGHKRVFAWGIRNPSGLAVDPADGQLWCAVNERDGLGDDLVPDYVTAVHERGFYGWPWWYLGAHQDPRHVGRHPELKAGVIVPDVLLQPHDAPLQLAFYDGAQFPGEYRGDIFVSSHGSWNRSVRTGYEVLRIHRHGGKTSGEYEDFLTGFVLPDGTVWGRPVGVAVAPDGSLLVSEDASDSIWRVSR